MTDYEPLDLSGWCNAGTAILGAQQAPALGRQTFHGLPFQIGGPDATGGDDRFLAFGSGGYDGPLRIPFGHTARRLIVAHRLLDSTLYEGGPVGETVAEYVI